MIYTIECLLCICSLTDIFSSPSFLTTRSQRQNCTFTNSPSENNFTESETVEVGHQEICVLPKPPGISDECSSLRNHPKVPLHVLSSSPSQLFWVGLSSSTISAAVTITTTNSNSCHLLSIYRPSTVLLCTYYLNCQNNSSIINPTFQGEKKNIGLEMLSKLSKVT